MKCEIIVATHKKYRMPKDSMYIPLHVGAEGKEDLGYMKDNKGENISHKNSSYCELTGLYWVWKNSVANYVGLAHYRRHFSLKKLDSEDVYNSILNEQEIMPLLDEYDVILPKKRYYYIETLYSHYKHTHYAIHLDLTREIIEDFYPEYLSIYDKVIKQTYGYMFNMFIMKKSLVDKYCKWVFDILFELEKRYQETNLSEFQGRFYGRVSEIIFNVWLQYQIENDVISDVRIKEINCIHIEKINWLKKGGSFLMAKFMKKRYEGSF